MPDRVYLAALLLALVAPPPSAHAALPVPTLGPIQTIFNWSTSHCSGCGSSPNCTQPNDPDVPDTPPRVFLDANGNAHLMAGDAASRLSIRAANSSDWVHNCTIFADSPLDCDPSHYEFQLWLHSPYALGWMNDSSVDTVVSLTHMEYHGWQCLNVSLCSNSSEGMCAMEAIEGWVSPDGGWSWMPGDAGARGAPYNMIAVSPYTYDYVRDNFAHAEFGFGDPLPIVRGAYANASDPYFYSIVNAANPPIGMGGWNGVQQRGACAIRSLTPADPTSWRAWDGVSYSVQFLNPYANNITNASAHACAIINTTMIHVGLGWSTYFGAWISSGFGDYTFANGTYIPCCGAWLYSISTDLVNWGPPQFMRTEIQEGQGLNWEYDPMFLDEHASAAAGSRNWHEVIGETAELWFWQHCNTTYECRNVLKQSVSFV